jgi:hypothetical protein
MVVVVGKGVGRYMQLVDEYFTVFDAGVGVFDICPAHPQRFHLGASELQPGLVFIDNKIIPSGLAVFGNDFDMFFFQNSNIAFFIGLR